MTRQYIQPGDRHYRRTISALFLGSFVTFAVLYCPQPLIPLFSAQFQASPATASLAVSLTTGALALSMLALSWVSDARGRKPIMTVALFGSAGLTLAAACSSNFAVLLAVRALQGVVLAGFPGIAMAYVGEEFDPACTGRVMGIYVSGTSVGGMLGRVIVGALTDWFSWRVALAVIGVAGLLVSAWFTVALPHSRNWVPRRRPLAGLIAQLGQNLNQPALVSLYLIGLLILGGFVALYNYIGYPLMAPPYNLSQSTVGLIFLVYLMGTFSSALMGRLADRAGAAKVLRLSLAIMLAGGLVTVTEALPLKILGVAVFTFGFFGSHSVASALVGQCATAGKSQASALYLLFYYLGSSIFGTFGGKFLIWYGWNGIVLFIALLLLPALLLAAVPGRIAGHRPVE